MQIAHQLPIKNVVSNTWLALSRFAGALLKPGDFPLRSNLSRAAARTILVQKLSVFERRITSRSTVPHGTDSYFDVKEHTAGTVISGPEAMNLAEALRALGGYSAVQLAKLRNCTRNH